MKSYILPPGFVDGNTYVYGTNIDEIEDFMAFCKSEGMNCSPAKTLPWARMMLNQDGVATLRHAKLMTERNRRIAGVRPHVDIPKNFLYPIKDLEIGCAECPDFLDLL